MPIPSCRLTGLLQCGAAAAAAAAAAVSGKVFDVPEYPAGADCSSNFRVGFQRLSPLKPVAHCNNVLERKPDAFVESYSQMVFRSPLSARSNAALPDTVPDADLTWWDTPENQKRIATLQINANDPVEDRVVVQEIDIPMVSRGKFLLAAVIDGHGGWQVADYVQRKLPGFIKQSMLTKFEDNATLLTPKQLTDAITEAFLALDRDIMEKISGSVEMGLSGLAKVGACCTAVLLTDDLIITANAGDCRTVLVQQDGHAIPLTTPHSANEQTERQRLIREHPGELDVVLCKKSYKVPAVPATMLEYVAHWMGYSRDAIEEGACYVKGRLQPTRSLGDFYLKDKRFAFNYESGIPLVTNAASFPYIVATPEVRIRKRVPNTENYLILGSDGVWDFLAPQEAADIIRVAKETNVQDAARSLVQAVIQKASKESSISLADIALLSPRQKRRIFDDTTVCIVALRN